MYGRQLVKPSRDDVLRDYNNSGVIQKNRVVTTKLIEFAPSDTAVKTLRGLMIR
jgi:hypothetical protein